MIIKPPLHSFIGLVTFCTCLILLLSQSDNCDSNILLYLFYIFNAIFIY